jgi:glycerate kinase
VKILIAPDSFKESLSAFEVANSIEKGILKFKPDIECIKIPLADGGEGTVDAILNASGGKRISVKVMDPLMREIVSFLGILPDNETAVIEMAAASGLELLSPEERNPFHTTSYGTGQLIKAALDHGCRKIYIGIGGSATNDGGAGMAMALGAGLLNAIGDDIMMGGGFLSDLHSIDLSEFDKRIMDCEMIVLSDVQNPLCGENGASYIYGTQKGADPEMISQLDSNLRHFGNILESVYGKRIIDVAGAGAAGGLGAGLMGFCNAKLKPGFDTISKIVQLEKAIEASDLVITGEGKLDYQTKFGKVPFGVAQMAKKMKKPVIGIAGKLGKDYKELYNFGFQKIYSISEGIESLEYSIANAESLLINASEKIISSISLTFRKK